MTLWTTYIGKLRGRRRPRFFVGSSKCIVSPKGVTPMYANRFVPVCRQAAVLGVVGTSLTVAACERSEIPASPEPETVEAVPARPK